MSFSSLMRSSPSVGLHYCCRRSFSSQTEAQLWLALMVLFVAESLCNLRKFQMIFTSVLCMVGLVKIVHVFCLDFFFFFMVSMCSTEGVKVSGPAILLYIALTFFWGEISLWWHFLFKGLSVLHVNILLCWCCVLICLK